ncbi:YitT family protein [Sporosarcina beigongshangi]|uniref:YitT family protein n=1 Tax=Sporosarcina beigongshangi TaxID=2782538 RepID=UPI001939E68D|nr:YitT family protein [Sporosarcina beigongshangi]
MYFFKRALVIVIGSTFIAIGLNGFLIPFGLLEGGALGISLIFHYLIGIKVGFTFLLVSIPIFIVAWIFYRPFFFNGIHGMLLSSLIIDVLSPLQSIGREFVISTLAGAICGGIIIGIGIGIMLCLDISIGGTDLLAQMLARKLTVNPGIMIFCLDVLIVILGSYIIPAVQLSTSLVTVCCVGITTSLLITTVSKARKRRFFDCD